MFTLTIAQQQDKPYLLNLRKITMAEHLEQQGLFLNDLQHMARIEDKFDHAYIIQYQATKIGMIKYYFNQDDLNIMQVQIHPEHQNKGLGAQLLKQIITSTQADNTYLSVLKSNPAIGLYKKLGFEVTSESEK